MIKLSDFLGGVISCVSDARMNSDLQSVQIAERYANDELLKHLSTTGMRIDKVEINIPLAISAIKESCQQLYEPMDQIQFSYKAYQLVLQSLNVRSLPRKPSMELKRFISEHTKIAKSKIKANDHVNLLEDFSRNIASKTLQTVVLSELKTEMITSIENDTNVQEKLENDLLRGLKSDIKVNCDRNTLENLEVEVESHKLQEISPENIMTIKMTITEHKPISQFADQDLWKIEQT